ncbi:hypothetical protein FHR23_000122 [Stakelama sediminis]|uniref:Uncharacterized protein n=1 Tax=Stakelama sediminis TaxID=463200 RepID=A0A840YUL5_9SPHN|nr:hypothetical protein [Stakelama sediminis]
MPNKPAPPPPLWRFILILTGLVLMVGAPIVGILPGPGGIFVFAAGLVLVLRNSLWARRHFARIKRRWPWFGDLADRALRRRSAARRRQKKRDSAR